MTNIIKGKQCVTPEMSNALGTAFGVSAELFTSLQEAYDLSNDPAELLITSRKQKGRQEKSRP